MGRCVRHLALGGLSASHSESCATGTANLEPLCATHCPERGAHEPFALKVLVIAVVAGSVFTYYLLDLRQGERPA
jgi:hypothetical protein